jgi:Ca-activated chloride channel homolog
MLVLPRVKEAGLYRKGGSVPLQGVSISVDVTDVASQVTVIQKFINQEEKPVEAAYCFPLEDGSAIFRFEVKIGERLIKGEIEERDKAFEKYDQAMTEGHGAVLLDQEDSNIFVSSVGNLMPGQEAVVSISYVSELPLQDEQIRLMIPTTVSPRYFPSGTDPVKIDLLSPPVSLAVPYGLSLEVLLRDAAKIAGVSSPSHRITVQTEEQSWKISLTESENRLDRDFILHISLKEPRRPAARLQTHPNGDRAIMFRLYPEFEPDAEVPHAEVIFLLDCSGSMQGSSIAHAKTALELCLKTLSEGDRFNIVRFGNGFQNLFDESEEYDDHTLGKAVAYVRKIKADLGGTEIYPALTHIFNMPKLESHRRELMVLTDGEVGNVSEVISLARDHRNDTRIFSFGIGYGSSESLVRGLATATHGAAEFISPDEQIEDKVLRQFSRVATPAMNNVRIDWKGMRIKQSPTDIPPIFSGDSFTVYGLIESGKPDGELTLTANIGEREVSWSAPVQSEDDGNLIPTLWARSYIRYLENAPSLDGGSRQIKRKDEVQKRKILETGLRYNLMSSQTSMVAVDFTPDSERATEQAQYRRIPIQLTKDWHGLPLARVGAFAGNELGMLVRSPIAMDSNSLSSDTLSIRRMGRQGANLDRPLVASPILTIPRNHAKTLWILELLQTQTAAGSFDSISDLPKLLPNSIIELQKWASRIENAPEAIRERVLATVLTLILLETRGGDSAKIWQRGASKAQAWLDKHAKDARLDGRPLYEVLKDLVENPFGS